MVFLILLEGVKNKTSRKWLTVAIFQKWQDSSVALWIEIAVEIEVGIMVWISKVWYGFVLLV